MAKEIVKEKEEKAETKKDKFLSDYVARKKRERGEKELTPRQEALLPIYLQNLMETAEAFDEGGQTHQALSVYSRIANEFPDSKEAKEARSAILEHAKVLRSEGKAYSSLALYDKLFKGS